MACIIQVIGKKDSGKTSAIEKAVKELKKSNLRVAVIKHSHHEIDVEGKDTFKFWEAGADIVTFHDSKCVTFHKCDLNMVYLLPVDVILIEGFKELDLGKKIEIKEPTEIDSVSRLIVEEAIKCRSNNSLIINGKKIECNDPLTLLLYNLLKYFNIREVKIED